MNYIKDFIKTHQQKIALTIGYLLVASLAFSVGRMTFQPTSEPQIKAPEKFALPANYTANESGLQSEVQTVAATTGGAVKPTCEHQIKGTTSGIYHLPGGAFYERVTKPIRCFDTETQAIAAGFRKSSK